MNKQIDISKLSTEELEKALAEKKQAEKAAAEEQRKQYEGEKENIINSLGKKAEGISSQLNEFKVICFTDIEGFRQKMLAYGDIKNGKNNKGNFEIKNDNYKIIYSSQPKQEFDERSELAEEKLKKFLSSFVRKRDKQLYELIMSMLERNSKTGALDISNINRLYKMEDKFDDQDWRDALRLFKESYNITGTNIYVRVYKHNDRNGWDLINLNFSSI